MPFLVAPGRRINYKAVSWVLIFCWKVYFGMLEYHHGDSLEGQLEPISTGQFSSYIRFNMDNWKGLLHVPLYLSAILMDYSLSRTEKQIKVYLLWFLACEHDDLIGDIAAAKSYLLKMNILLQVLTPFFCFMQYIIASSTYYYMYPSTDQPSLLFLFWLVTIFSTCDAALEVVWSLWWHYTSHYSGYSVQNLQGDDILASDSDQD